MRNIFFTGHSLLLISKSGFRGSSFWTPGPGPGGSARCSQPTLTGHHRWSGSHSTSWSCLRGPPKCAPSFPLQHTTPSLNSRSAQNSAAGVVGSDALTFPMAPSLSPGGASSSTERSPKGLDVGVFLPFSFHACFPSLRGFSCHSARCSVSGSHVDRSRSPLSSQRRQPGGLTA